MKATFLAVAVLATAGVVFRFSTTVHAAKASGPKPAAAPKPLPSKSLSLPLFFEPNQGQTAPQVKFLARGAGYGLFLTADEAVLQLQPSAVSTQHSALSSERAPSSVIRMRLDGANSSARVSGTSPLPGKSNYFIGNDPSKWHHDIPQFGRVEYQAVYPGVDLVYYGDQGQIEYDFRVAPAADPNQIALSFNGASAHIISGDSGNSGDLILSTANGDVRFRAPHIYQPAAPQSGRAEKKVAGSFRQLADNKIGFTIENYDHSRELVIDPILSYSTYLGGSNAESLVHVAIGPDSNIYLAGSTLSTDFPLPPAPPAVPPFQLHNAGTQNIFIAVIDPNQPPAQQLLYATYLGGNLFDYAAGIGASLAVDSGIGIGTIDVYVAGWTTSTNFPTSGVYPAFQAGPPAQPGTHGFVARLNLGPTTTLRYSTYLAGTNGNGNATDIVTGLAIDNAGDAFVTGITTSTDDQSNGFPANPNGFQLVSHAPSQFFASKILTTINGNGAGSMLYSTYFGGGNPQTGKTQGGGIAVDANGDNMYITGGTSFLGFDAGSNVRFPLFNAQQSCLDEVGNHGICTLSNPTAMDAFVAKINPNAPGANPVFSTYVGGQGDDVGFGIAIDTSGDAYITGSTNSTDFIPSSLTGAFQPCLNNTNLTTPCTASTHSDAFIAKIGSAVSGSIYPLNYATYIGGSGDESGQAIQVDSVQAAHVTGSTGSADLPVTSNASQSNSGGGEDAFVALISTTLSGRGAGDYLTYLGGSGTDQGSGIAIDSNTGAAYVAGTTQSGNFPTKNPLQPNLNSGSQDAFVSRLGAYSTVTVTVSTSPVSPTPNPVNAGAQVAFTFDITNIGTDNASQVTFFAFGFPTTGVASPASAKIVSGGSGSCPLQGSEFVCNIGTLAVNAVAKVEVDVTPSIPVLNKTFTVSGNVSWNGGPVGATVTQPAVNVVDFSIAAPPPSPIDAGNTATILVTFCPTDTILGYNATITPSQTISGGMVTATTPTFNPTTVALSGSACQNTTLSIATVARPVVTGSLLRRGSFYAAWLPIGGLSLVGLGLGASRKRRRWLAGAVLCLIAGAVLLQSGCGSSSSGVSPGGGTQPGTYTVTISGSAGTGASHSTQVALTVR